LAPVKYTRKFHDYRYAQNTLIPYRTVLLEDGKQTLESRILNVTFGIKLDDALFKNPEA
jgi:outer membrane lipoprotein-sorting protein